MTENHKSSATISYSWSVLFLIPILVLGAYLGVQTVLHTNIDNPLRADARDYFTYAYNIRHFHIYSSSVKGLVEPGARPDKPDALRTPGYPLFLSIFTGNQNLSKLLLNVSLTQVLLSVISLIFLYITVRLFLSRPVSLLVTLFTAISPHLVNMNIYMLTEPLYTFLLVISLFLFSRLDGEKNIILAFFAGLAIAYAALTRPALQYFIFILIPLIYFSFDKAYAKKISLLLFTGFILVFGAWLVRNVICVGKLTDPTLVKNTLQHGMYPDMMYKGIKQSRGIPYRFDPNTADIAKDTSSVLHEIKRRFSEEPARHLQWYLVGKPVTFWSWGIIAGMGDVFVYPVTKSPYFNQPLNKVTHDIMHYLHWPLVVLAFIGCLLALFAGKYFHLSTQGMFIVRVMALLLLYFTALHMIAAPFPRYSIPLRPFLYAMAMVPFLWLYRLIKR